MKRTLLLLLAVFTFSCNNFNSLLRSTDVDERYEGAMEYYENGDYYRAGILFEELLPQLMGSAKAEKLQFNYAYTHFYQRNFTGSANYFRNFYDTYRRSPLAEEALYMYGHSLYQNTPDFNLDQSNTTVAIAALQDFINLYPNSSFAPDARDQIDELQNRLERKAFEVAKLYQTLGRYKAASVALLGFTRDYPDSELKEEALVRRMQAYYDYARLSLPSKQEERYKEVMEMYMSFAERYDKSIHSAEAERVYQQSRKDLDNVIKQKEQAEKAAQAAADAVN